MKQLVSECYKIWDQDYYFPQNISYVTIEIPCEHNTGPGTG